MGSSDDQINPIRADHSMPALRVPRTGFLASVLALLLRTSHSLPGWGLIMNCEDFHGYTWRHHCMIWIPPRPRQSIKLKGCIVPFGHFDVQQWIRLMVNSAAPGPGLTC